MQRICINSLLNSYKLLKKLAKSWILSQFWQKTMAALSHLYAATVFRNDPHLFNTSWKLRLWARIGLKTSIFGLFPWKWAFSSPKLGLCIRALVCTLFHNFLLLFLLLDLCANVKLIRHFNIRFITRKYLWRTTVHRNWGNIMLDPDAHWNKRGSAAPLS
jgi:hypothetical protein